MLDQEGLQNLWDQVHTNYVAPEVEKWQTEGRWSQKMRIGAFRVWMPNDRPVIVEFNDDIGWRTEAKHGDGRDLVRGRRFICTRWIVDGQ